MKLFVMRQFGIKFTHLYFFISWMNTMPLLKHSSHKIATLLALTFSGCLFAANSSDNPTLQSPEIKRVSDATQRVMREQIIEDAQNTFTLLGAELAAERGDTTLALNTYLRILANTQDPEVAERAIELATSTGNFLLSEQIFQIWQKIEPNASPAQRRIAWARALGQGDVNHTFGQLNTILNEASNEQIKRIFLLLAQVSLHNPDMLRTGNKQVYQLVTRYPNMLEANILDLVFSTGNREKSRILSALKKLSQIDENLSLPSRSALSFVVHEQPDTLSDFFDKNDSLKLSPTWQELEIENLIQNKQYKKASTRLQTLLAKKPQANLYFLAAVQSFEHNKNSDNNQVKQYLEQAYNIGTPEQKSRAATMMMLNFLNEKNWVQSANWLKKIESSDYAFVKNVLEMSLSSAQNDWEKTIALYNNQRSLTPNLQTHFFDNVQREQIYLSAMMQVRKPAIVLNEINQLIKKAQQQGDAARLNNLIYQRGILYSDKMHRPHDAIKDLRAFLILNPDNAHAQNSLGYTLLSQPETVNEGFDLITKAYQAQPESAAINDSMGWAYFQKGDYETAKIYLEYAYKNEPTNAEIAAHLGELYWKLGDTEQAKKIWKESWLQNKNDFILQKTLKNYQIRF